MEGRAVPRRGRSRLPARRVASAGSRAAPWLLQEINQLRTRPWWYNALTENYTAGMQRLARVDERRWWWSWKLFLSSTPRRRLALLGALCLGLGACAAPVGAVRVDPKVAFAISRGARSRRASRAGRPATCSSSGPVRRLRRASRGRHRRAASRRWSPRRAIGPALRAGRAVLSARPGDEETRVPAGGRGLRLCVPLPGGRRRRASGPFDPRFRDRGGPVQLGARPRPSPRRTASEVVPRGGTFALPFGRIDGGVRSRRAARRGPRAVSVHPRSRSWRCTVWRCGIAGRASAPRSRPRRGRSTPRSPAGDMVAPRLRVPLTALLRDRRMPDALSSRGSRSTAHAGAAPRLGRGHPSRSPASRFRSRASRRRRSR